MNHQGPEDNELRSRWRETLFMLRQLRWCVCPALGLDDALRSWPAISAALSENPRKRARQTGRIAEVLRRELG